MTPTEAKSLVLSEHPHACVQHYGCKFIVVSNHDNRPLGGWTYLADNAWVSAAKIIVQQRRVEDEEAVLGGERGKIGSEVTTCDVPNVVIESN